VPLLIDSNVAYTTDEKGEKAFGHTRCFIRDDTGRRVREARAAAMLEETRCTVSGSGHRASPPLPSPTADHLSLPRRPCGC
jgi:hypothetical protein